MIDTKLRSKNRHRVGSVPTGCWIINEYRHGNRPTNSNPMRFSSATFAYPQLDLARRGALARRLSEVDPPHATFILSTCLRIEVAVADDTEALRKALDHLFSDLEPSDGLVREGHDAVHHLFRVAAGLESPILGERDILTQFRRAVLDANETDSMDGAAQRLLQAGVAAARRARETLPAAPHDSMAEVAAGLVENSDQVTVLGSGDMATAVVRSLGHSETPPRIVVLARRPKLVEIPGMEVWDFDRLGEALATHRTIISATSATSRLLSEDEFQKALASRTERLTLIDLAMPPDFAPPAEAAIDHYDIDQLAGMVDQGAEATIASAIVDEMAATAFGRFTGHSDVGPVIQTMMSDADAIVERTVERFAAKLASDVDEAVLRRAAHAVARAILSSPVEFLNNSETDADGVDTIARAFGVEDA